MFKPSDTPLLAGLALAAGLIAPSDAAVTPLTDAKAGYQLRCWQEGRLVFEENQVNPPSPVGAMRVVALDRGGRPIYLIDSPSATCMLRHLEERPEPPPGLPQQR